MEYTITVKHFKDLNNIEVYQILRLRNEVFVVEQNIAYQDADNKDIYCYHLMFHEAKELIAYARLVPPGLSYETTSIGRVTTSKQIRGKGMGKELMIVAINNCYAFFGKSLITISAQVYTQAFYESLGFSATGEVYDEDGIEHIRMIKRPA